MGCERTVEGGSPVTCSQSFCGGRTTSATHYICHSECHNLLLHHHQHHVSITAGRLAMSFCCSADRSVCMPRESARVYQHDSQLIHNSIASSSVLVVRDIRNSLSAACIAACIPRTQAGDTRQFRSAQELRAYPLDSLSCRCVSLLLTA